MFDEKANQQETFQLSECLPEPNEVECLCVHLALDGLVLFFYFPHWSYFRLRICSSPLACRCKCVFFSAQLHTAGFIQHKPFYLISSFTFTHFHPSVQLNSLIWTLQNLPLHSFNTLFSSTFPLFSVHNLLSVSTVCAAHVSLLPPLSVMAVLQGSLRQLTKRTVRSMIITLQL